MSSQAFLWAGLGLVIFIVLIFTWGKKGLATPSRLNMKKGNYNPNSKAVVKKKYDSAYFQSPDIDGENIKSLNVIFMFNGHSFDAYEILGIPAGSSFQVAAEAHQKMVAQTKTSESDFYDTALKAIELSKK